MGHRGHAGWRRQIGRECPALQVVRAAWATVLAAFVLAVDDGFLSVVDGVPVYERLDQTSGVAPDTSTIDAITVVTGYVPPEFGYKAGGVVELPTRAATDAWKGSYELGVGSDSVFESSATVGSRIEEPIAPLPGGRDRRVQNRVIRG